jgi:hypothetical protein
MCSKLLIENVMAHLDDVHIATVGHSDISYECVTTVHKSESGKCMMTNDLRSGRHQPSWVSPPSMVC